MKAEKPGKVTYSEASLIEAFEQDLPSDYLIGPGDELSIEMWGDERLSGLQVVDPFGNISIPLLGDVQVSGKSRARVQADLREALSKNYADPLLHVRVAAYNNNRVFVLGQVNSPGIVSFTARPTLLEALAVAGAMPSNERINSLQRCAVMRGKDKIIWLDLNELLLGGNLSLNLTLANNDVVFIPDAHEPYVYVMGQVNSPGAYRLTSNMSLLDALMRAGGLSRDGKQRNIAVIRQHEDGPMVAKVNLKRFYRGDIDKNFVLEDGDIIYVRTKNIARFEYLMRSITPFTSLLVINEALSSDDTATTTTPADGDAGGGTQ
ncbi:SLBB domain-containing protein [Acanthopleuribacter pedis]|uniref:SLBB domain-containing protein n=1 Tax=Acanthopleuribacter pedis TaxID=442870 RepID=A0A8J7QF17_9BACT|nr:SLBB domain-containing protein [Acanthopleuribacter pedis]